MTADGLVTGADLFPLLDALQAHRMPCSITDGQQFDEFEEGMPGEDDLDPDARYDELRQQEVDDLNDTLADIARTQVK